MTEEQVRKPGGVVDELIMLGIVLVCGVVTVPVLIAVSRCN